MGKFGSPEKSWRKQVVLALVLALLVNFSVPLAWHMPEVTRAYAASGDVILLWDTANGAVPGGWTNISGLVGDPFYGVFPRAAASYGAATAGSDTHTHALTYSTSTGPSATTTTADPTAGANEATSPTHTHTWGNMTSAAGDVRPPFKDLVFIRANNPATIPSNAIAIFDTGSLPAGWTRYTALDGNYLRGFSDNLTGGAATHTHTTTVTSATAAVYIADSANITSVARSTHTHTITNSLTTTGTNAQPYVEVVFAYNSSGGATSIPNGMIAMFDAAPTGNWSIVSNAAPWTGNFLKGSTSYGATGGSSVDHNHGASQIFTSGAPSATRTIGSGAGRTPATDTHTHNATYTIANSGNPLPVYRDTIFGKYSAPASDSTPPTTSGLTFDSPVSGTYVGSPFNFHGDLTDNESTVSPPCQYCVKNGSECTSADTWTAGTLSGSSPTWTCTASGVTTYTSGGAITNGDAVYIDVRGTSAGGQNTNGGTAITRTMDKLGPNSGASFTATPGNTTCTLNWSTTTDAGSGMHATEPYEVRWQQGSDPGSCTGGAQLYIGTGTSTPHNSLTNDLTYYYRLCYKDVLNNQSGFATNPITCVPTAPAVPTRFYFPADTAADVNPPFNTWTSTTGALSRKLSQTKGTTAITAGSTISWTAGGTALDRQYVSAPLEAQTISGTVKSYLMTLELAGTDNATSRLRAYVVSNDGQTVRGTLLALGQYGPATEYLNAAYRNKGFADGDTVSSVVAQSGDRIVVEIGHSDAAGTTPQASANWGENAADCAENETGLTACAGWIEFSDTITFSVPSASGLIHNSTTTSSAKWSPNGWGVAGGKYGEFTCETCHVKSTTDIKRIKTTITTPDGSNFQGRATNSVSVNFQSATTPNGFGDDATNTPRASSTKVCEVCHTYDNTQANGVNTHPYSVGVALPNHKGADNTDCMTCHQHNKGFAASCDICHGYPPTNAGTHGGPDGLADNNGATAGGWTGSTIVGTHNAHVTTGNITCTACHYGSVGQGATHNNGDLNITIGFYPFSTAQGGTYNGQATANYNATTTSPATAVTKSGAKTCVTVYCHGGSITPVASPTWDGTIACGTNCHKATNADPPTIVNHPRHAGTGAGQLGLACTVCHPSRTIGWDGHVDANVQWQLATGNPLLGNNAKYNSLATGSTGTKAPSSAYGTCATVYCHSSVQSNPGTGAPASYDSPTWGAASVACDSCHGQGTGADNGGPSTGSHERHVTTYAYTCTVCHSGLGEDAATHADHTINLAFDAATAGGSAAYSRTNSITPQSGTFGTCATTFCHGASSNTSAETGTWGTDLSAADACTVCHGTKTTAADGGAAVINRAPGGNGTGVDTNGDTAVTDAQVGAHDAHLRSLMNISSDIACNECHAVPTADVAGIKGHLDGTPADITFGTLAKTGGLNPTTNLPTSPTTCTNTYCHGKATFAGTDTTPTWNNSAYLPATMTTAGCGMCHAYPPAGHAAGNCDSCHTHVAAGATPVSFVDATKHINGTVEGGDCIGCHSKPQDNLDGAPTRRDMTTEITTFTHGHAKTLGSWTKQQCGVCHMEGDPATGNTTALHKNNTLDFRDPDSGVTIKGVTFSGTPGSYSPTVTDATAAVFARNTGSTTLEAFAQAVMVNMCLKCHDSGGAASTAARVSGGTATQPFGTTAGTRIDVDTDFTTTNATYHPVKGRQNNSYSDANTLSAPWNAAGSPGGTKTTKTSLTNWGWLMTCWDCHDSSAANRTIGGTTAPSIMHGNAATVRAAYDAVGSQATGICAVCHLTSVYFTTSTHLANNTVSALQVDTPADEWSGGSLYHTLSKWTYRGCTVCHGMTQPGGTLPAAGLRSPNVHGSNYLGSADETGTTQFWTSGARPWSFLRNTMSYADWDNDNASGNGYCDMNGSPGCRGTTGQYTPGGTY